ncbi:MAG: CPBP family intramembrane metalloprotease [Chloroflexi bacterium]|nr:MAG: CPBP family intramembrane metalloprotease [Chloroflexota bacterium]
MAAGVYRTTIAASWRWMRLDLLLRLLPLALAPLLVAWLTRTPLDAFGLSVAHPLRDLLVAAPLGLAGFAVATAFAEYLARRSRRCQGGLLRWWNAPVLAVLVSTAVFGGYHFLDRWGWRPVIGATAAGLALGLIYLWQPSPASLLSPVLVHAAITCGFLSVGPFLLFQWRRARRGREAA